MVVHTGEIGEGVELQPEVASHQFPAAVIGGEVGDKSAAAHLVVAVNSREIMYRGERERERDKAAGEP